MPASPPSSRSQQNVRWSINAQNILDTRVPSFIGVPDVGRFITTRISYNF
jgi:hypothetical protein